MHTRYVVLFLLLALAPLAWPPPSTAQIAVVPGSSVRGEDLFRTKGCIDCHAFNGAGGKLAPDLSQRDERVRTPMQLASAMWNHAPRMWAAQDARPAQSPRAVLDSADTADLFAHFYSLSFVKSAGNPQRGASLFEEKGCSSCHDTTVKGVRETRKGGARPGPPISTWAAVDDPLGWAEHMWNHAGKIYSEFASAGFAWPRFSGQDMADLLAYFRALPEARSQTATFQPGDPEQGRLTFERRCESCHSFGGRTAQTKIDLTRKPAPDVLTGYVVAMWNHAPTMYSRAGKDFPILGRGDMSNLVAYLFAQRYFDDQGDPARGARVFAGKNCIICHEEQRKQTGAPDLTMGTERYSPITMSAAVWRHGPSMLKSIQKQKLSWPEIKPAEMADLIAYLNSRLVPRVAR